MNPDLKEKTVTKKREGVQATAIERRKWAASLWALKFLVPMTFTLA